jgi:hypothetical protein
MTQAQWQRVRDLFERALADDPQDLDGWLGREAAGDEQVRAEVASLLRHHGRVGSFLADAVTDRLPDLLADERALAPGQVIGSYSIVREIGRGGMGRVYLATDERLGRTVALKALPPELTEDVSQRERLRREARAAASLTHPGICTVYALEELEGQLFIATEFLDGRTLREEISAGPRPSAQAVLQAAREIAAALATAHAKGLVHRDLKPENVMRTRDGRLKILDFGLARGESGIDAVTGRITQPGVVVGTPAYMAPEQLEGDTVDARSDVFAFGVLLYEYASGRHPFEASTPLALAARLLESEALPLDRAVPELPRGFVEVIERCLRKRPADRFRSAIEIGPALAVDKAAPPPAGSARWWRTHQIVVVGLYLVAALLAWQVKEWENGLPNVIFFAIGGAATVGGVFRGHLVFTERVHGRALTAEWRRAAPVTLAVDLVIALALVLDGAILSTTREVAAVLTLALALGVAIGRLVIEPSTTQAAFAGPAAR